MPTPSQTPANPSQSQPQSLPPQTPDAQSAMSRKLATDHRYYWFLVAFLVAESTLGSMVNDMYSPALPAMTRYFGCPVPLAQMGLTMGMIGLGLGQFILGPMSDRYGRRPVLLGSSILFIVAAIVSIFSPSIHFFNICRLFQGMGAAGGYFLARTIPADVYTGRQLAKLMALVGAINGIAPASAPVIGGFTSETWGWRAVFIVLAAIAVVLLALSPMVKESLPDARRTQGAWWRTIRFYGNLLRNRPFMIHVSFKGISLGLMFSYVSASPFILQTHYGLSQTSYGLIIGFNAIFLALGSMLALRFHPFERAARAGAIIAAAGFIGQAVALWTVHSIWLFEGLMVISLFGLGMVFATTNTLAMNEGRAQAGMASALLGISGYVVGAIVAPLVGMGNVLHSTAIVFAVVSVLVLVCSQASHRLPSDLD